MEPFDVRLGNYKATIYKVRRHPPLYTICWYEGRQRRKRSRAELEGEDGAKAEATRIVTEISQGKIQHTQIPTDRLTYLLECERDAIAGGFTLHQAVQEALLGSKKRTALKPATTGDLLKALLEEKTQDDVSDDYHDNLRTVLGKFVAEFPGLINEVVSTDINAWLRGLKIKPRSRKNTLRSIRLLFTFAQGKKAVPQDAPTEADLVKMPKVKDTHAPDIFTVDEMGKLLNAACPGGKATPLLPVLVLGAFCGVRTDGEIQRFEWSEILENQVVVAKQKLRTAGRRFGPLPDNAKAWLAKCEDREGLIWKRRKLSRAISECAEAAGVKWKRNALRHSFISYYVAEIQDVARAALESGNSPTMIHRHYRELVTKAQASEWFALMPSPLALPAAN